MSDNESWNGNSRPFNGAEDGVPFEEGNDAAKGHGRPSEHGLYQFENNPEAFFNERPEARAELDERIETLREEAANPKIDEGNIYRMAMFDVMLKYTMSGMAPIDGGDKWDVVNRLSNTASRTRTRIDWKDEREHEKDVAERASRWEEYWEEPVDGESDEE